MKKKRTLSPEHLAKLQAGRARKAAEAVAPTTTPEPSTVFLDVTKENVVNEMDLVERIRRLFDEGKNPNRLLVTSRQMMDLLFNSPNIYRDTNHFIYDSPFGSHRVVIVPAKDIA